nr:DNA repair protein RadC [uncultured Devosia sp.]
MMMHSGLDDAGKGTSLPLSEDGPDYDQVRVLARLLESLIGPAGATDQATRLLARFGPLPAVLQAEAAQLDEVSGVSPATIRLLGVVSEVVENVARKRAYPDRRPILSASSELVGYLHLTMTFLPVEQARVLFLNKKNRLIADEVMQTGTVDHTPFYVRQIIKRALELGATALILVHNHPSGDPSPSARDVRTTRDVIGAVRPLGIVIHDHIIVARSGHSSMRALKLLSEG